MPWDRRPRRCGTVEARWRGRMSSWLSSAPIRRIFSCEPPRSSRPSPRAAASHRSPSGSIMPAPRRPRCRPHRAPATRRSTVTRAIVALPSSGTSSRRRPWSRAPDCTSRRRATPKSRASAGPAVALFAATDDRRPHRPRVRRRLRAGLDRDRQPRLPARARRGRGDASAVVAAADRVLAAAALRPPPGSRASRWRRSASRASTSRRWRSRRSRSCRASARAASACSRWPRRGSRRGGG